MPTDSGSDLNSGTEGSFVTPVGDGNYVVQQGDCLESIAFPRGFLWQTIWNHPRNAVFQQAGRLPNVLLPGDQLYIPDLDPKTIDAATDQRHAFCLKGVPSKIQIRVVKWVRQENEDSNEDATDSSTDEETTGNLTAEPRANIPYVIVIDDQTFSGQTDDDGCLVQTITPIAKKGKLILEPGTDNVYEITLVLGSLDPLDASSGVCQRLANLGFAASTDYSQDSPEFKDAVQSFQLAYGIEPTGVVDSDTNAKLKELHRS